MVGKGYIDSESTPFVGFIYWLRVNGALVSHENCLLRDGTLEHISICMMEARKLVEDIEAEEQNMDVVEKEATELLRTSQMKCQEVTAQCEEEVQMCARELLAIRHMDIRRNISGNLRPLMTNIPASSMYSVRSGPAPRSRTVSVSDSPLATSSNASSEVSTNDNALCVDTSVYDDDFNSERGVPSLASVGGINVKLETSAVIHF